MQLPLKHPIFKILSGIAAEKGIEAYVIGGYVRDLLLQRPSQDIDIVVHGSGIELAETAARRLGNLRVSVFKNFGTAMFRYKGMEIEFVGARKESYRANSRKPIVEEGTIDDDQKRRDFTINAMAYNDDVRLVDVFGGMQDLNHHLIRCVGDPRERFSEDALRILRAVRFSAQLDFPIEPDTAKAVKELAPNLKNISAERIQTELVKLLTSPHPERIQDACELGITKVVLPEWDAMVGVKQNTIHHKYDVAEHTLHTLKHVKRDKYLRLTMLFHDMGKPAMKTTDEKGNDHFKGHALESEKIARTVLKRLKFDNETIRIVTKLVCYHDYRMEATPANVRRAMNRIGVELFPYYLAVRLSDAKSQSTYMRREKIENIVEIRNLYKQILMENQCVTLRQLAVSGRELMELGMKPGRELGAMLSELLEYVLDDPERNTKENLCKYVKEKMEKEK
mgnify:CR=1 FL=1